MRKFKDVLRLKYEAGLSQRQIASALHLSLGVVNKYLNAAQAAGITWPPPEDLSESQLRRNLFPPESSSPEPVYAPPDFAAIHQELKRKGVTRQLLWEEYAAANPDNHYQYTQFCFHYQQWRSRLRLSMRQVHRAGEKMFVDYAGTTVPIISPTTGEIHEANIFVAVLGASNYTYAEATYSQQLHDWIGSHVRAFEFFQGAPKLVIPDNPKSGVTRADRYEPVLNRSYQEMLEHYSTAALPARPRKPKDKSWVSYCTSSLRLNDESRAVAPTSTMSFDD
jgi:transposase